MDESNIPKGLYCYDHNGICPYWSISRLHESQNNGYCSFLKRGDWEVDFGLLWDQVKECNINNDLNGEQHMFEQWLTENALSSSFRLNKLLNDYGILSTIVAVHNDVEIIKLTKTVDNDLSNQVDGKYFVLPSFIETEFVEEVENVASTKSSKVKKLQPGEESIATGA